MAPPLKQPDCFLRLPKQSKNSQLRNSRNSRKNRAEQFENKRKTAPRNSETILYRGAASVSLSRARQLAPVHPQHRSADAALSLRARFAIGPTLMTDETAKPTLTDSEIVRRLRTIRYSPRAPRIGRRIPGIRTVARHAGLSFRTVYTIVQTGRLKPTQALALAMALEAVQDGP